ncbi:tripartite tricarboxylate transporter TctB family protein [Xanthobacteraceae bacterium Astr-EGSB]|uniref:tripartite tricarboxylate transporter TctB family protein n=1 Tax=Astrobacterium formosum TaxID=3069710 RepID=UPI0027B4E74C|nr:tripartite tricarboxylate transporter TctB family protein [Xanthobacteraceae bacterium Astr-EGSB]
MKSDIAKNKDVLAGLLFMAMGSIAFYISLGYRFGTTVRMGPGYFPRVLSLLLVGFGITILIKGIRKRGKLVSQWGWVSVGLLTLAMVLFGFMIEALGLLPALATMFLVAAYAGNEFRLREVFVLTVVMSMFAVVVFIWGLNLPYPLFAWNF